MQQIRAQLHAPCFFRCSPGRPITCLLSLITPLHIASIYAACCLGLLGLLALLPPCALLEQCVAAVGQVPELAVLDAHQPVAEAAADASIDGVDPERLFVEQRAHLNAELP
jgi:hypothetical protein